MSRRRRPTSQILRDMHFKTRRSTQRDWRHDAPPMTPEQHFRWRARQWLYFNS